MESKPTDRELTRWQRWLFWGIAIACLLFVLSMLSSCASPKLTQQQQYVYAIKDYDPPQQEVQTIDYGYWKEDIAPAPPAETTETSWLVVTLIVLAGILIWL